MSATTVLMSKPQSGIELDNVHSVTEEPPKAAEIQSNEALEPASPILKAVREYERDRQRTKKAQDHVKAKERKEMGKGMGAVVGTRGEHPSSKRVGRKGGKVVKGGRWWDSLMSVTVAKEEPLPSEDIVDEKSIGLPSSEAREVNLAELLTTGKPRKVKGSSDFELVPHVRSVIVLDDAIEGGAELGEAWEYVGKDEMEEGDTKKAPSYAAVVSGAQ